MSVCVIVPECLLNQSCSVYEAITKHSQLILFCCPFVFLPLVSLVSFFNIAVLLMFYLVLGYDTDLLIHLSRDKNFVYNLNYEYLLCTDFPLDFLSYLAHTRQQQQQHHQQKHSHQICELVICVHDEHEREMNE